MLTRFSYLFLVCTLAISAFLFVQFNRKDAQETATYIGVDRCRVCHESVSSGDQFARWLESPHSHAFTALTTDSAIRYMNERGLTTQGCLPCHSTVGRPGLTDAEHSLNREGIGCERCHGAGSEYSFFAVMKDHPAFLAAGGVSGSLRDCYQCHARDLSAEAPHCPFQRTNFIADSSWLQIRHPIPTEQLRPDTVLELR